MLSLFRRYLFEVTVVALVGLLSYYYQPNRDRIFADGVGYYDYLPSIFIHHDFIRKDDTGAIPERIAASAVHVNYDERKVNKYHCGTALLMSPFFFVAYITSHDSWTTGYETGYHTAMLFSALFYLLLALLFLKKLLQLYSIRPVIIHASQFVMVFATNILYYTAIESSFSHIYSLFAITTFLYCAKHYLLQHNTSHIIWCGVLLGLIFIIRPVNILIVLFLPFIAGGPNELRMAFMALKKQLLSVLLAITLVLAVISIQLIAWYVQTGHWFVYSYGKESFNFGDPHFREILFSFRKGLFVYTPVLLIALGSLLLLIRSKSWYLLVTFLIPFILVTYVLSSWHDWVYGYSYGLRAFIEYFPMFFILIGLLLQSRSRWIRFIYIPMGIFTALNLIQTWQYKEYILHWYTMDYAKYKKIFLQTSAPYRGLLWKPELNEKEFIQDTLLSYPNISVSENTFVDTVTHIQVSDLVNESKPSAIRISFDHNFPADNTSQIELNIMRSTDQVVFSRSVYLIHFADEDLGTDQRGAYWYDLQGVSVDTSDYLMVRVFTEGKADVIRNVEIEAFRR